MISPFEVGEKAEYYRQQALEALERAKSSRNDMAREGWLRLAEQWNPLARYAEDAANGRQH